MPRENEEEHIISSWEELTQPKVVFYPFERDGQTLKLKCEALSHDQWRDIQKQTAPPSPPEKPALDQKGRVIKPIRYKPDPDDQGYQKKRKLKEDERTFLVLETAVLLPNGWEIPGKNWVEKFNRLSKMVAGELIALFNFILEISELTLKPGDLDFFDRLSRQSD